MGLGSWLIGAVVGTLAAIMLWVLGGWGFVQGAFMGGVLALIVGGLVAYVMTRPLPKIGEVSVTPASPGETAAKAEKVAPTVEANKGKIKPSAPLAGQAELAARKGSWTYEPVPTVQDAINKTAGGAAAKPKKAAAKKTAPKPTPSAAPAAEAAADDLKLIGGVGPALEKKLNAAGIFRFEQIADMSAEDVEKVEEQLSFKGRMQRDDWFGQAKILAAGGDTEFSAKKRKS